MKELAPDVEVRLIAAAATIEVRWPVLRAGMPRESAIFPGDEAPETRHLGAFVENDLKGVVTIYPAEFPDQLGAVGSWQLRGMGVLPEAQRRGIGEALLRACLREAAAAGGRLMWCNARVTAAAFYARNGWLVSCAEFNVPTAGPHVRMWTPLV